MRGKPWGSPRAKVTPASPASDVSVVQRNGVQRDNVQDELERVIAVGGTVRSVFARTGAVVAVTSDYDAVQVDVTPAGAMSSTNVQAALEEIQTDATTGITNAAAAQTTANAAIPKSIIDAKGDLIAGTGSDTSARLAVGSDGKYLRAKSSEGTGLEWGSLPTADATTQGIVELATDAETETGTDTARATTPANVASAYPKKSMLTTAGDIPYATGASTWARLPIGTSDGLVLGVSSGALAWLAVTFAVGLVLGDTGGNADGLEIEPSYDVVLT